MKSIVLTGTSSGLGQSLLRNLLSTQSKVLAIDRFPNPKYSNSEFQAELHLLQLDLSDDLLQNLYLPDSIFIGVSELIFVMNAATIQPLTPGLEIQVSELRTTFNINFFSYVNLIQKLASRCEHARIPFKIFLISTGSIFQPIYGWSAYSASKGSLLSFCRHIALENESIVFEAFDPGVFNSKIQEQVSAFNIENSLSYLPNILIEASEVSERIIQLLKVN